MNAQMTRKVLAALENEGVLYKIFGGVALNLHGLARATEDLDLFIAPELRNVERLKKALYSVFEDPDLEEIDGKELIHDYPAVQYIPPGNGFHIDILTRLGEAFSFEDLEAETIVFEGLGVNVVTPRTLYEMKKDTIRPRDRGDADRLRLRFGFEDD